MRTIDLTVPESRLADLVALLGGTSVNDAREALSGAEGETDDPWFVVASGLVSLRNDAERN